MLPQWRIVAVLLAACLNLAVASAEGDQASDSFRREEARESVARTEGSDQVNAHEQSIADTLREYGWTVLRKGWPDLLCYRRSNEKNMVQIAAVEVKGPGDRVSLAQLKNHAVLINAGIPVFVMRIPDPSALDDSPVFRKWRKLDRGRNIPRVVVSDSK
jgi:hypothetical protein